jgi:murein DD-endopeptidase MepM/ murein hydrolase activator NlpD
MTMRSHAARLIGLATVAALATPHARAEHAAIDLPAPPGNGDRPDELALRTRDVIERPSPTRRRKRARFSNGPRAVPRPRGAALIRARALGIGGHSAAKHLLWSRPSPELLQAVPGDRPRSLLWPVVNGRWGRGFGYTRRVRTELRHNGIDIGAKSGTPVRAAAAGLVIYSDNTLDGLGNAVLVLHPGGWTTLYGHNLRNTVQAGWYVQRGERIALVGQTGKAWGPHLHFELRDNGRWRDPAPFITGYRDPVLAGPLVELNATERESAAARDEKSAPPDNGEGEPNAPTPAVAAGDPEQPATLPFQVGTLAAAQRLLRAAPQIPDDTLLGRRFSNLLWPVKTGRQGRGFHPARHRAIDLTAESGAPVRVAADGVVIYSGDGLRGYGHAIVVLHRSGWVTIYGSIRPDGAADAGSRVLRGEWIGRVAAARAGAPSHLHFEWLVAGERSDPSDHFVGRQH